MQIKVWILKKLLRPAQIIFNERYILCIPRDPPNVFKLDLEIIHPHDGRYRKVCF